MTEVTEICPICERKLKPSAITINGKITKIKLLCRYCDEKDKPKGSVIPKRCPDCESVEIKFNSTDRDGDDWWECNSCTSQFRWKKYIAVFCVEVEFESTPDEAEMMACELLREGEPELLGYWEDGKYDANVNFSKTLRKKEGENEWIKKP